MDWEQSLATSYLHICNAYEQKLWTVCQRFTNGGYKRFSDEEVMTLYVLGTLMGLKTMKHIHQYARPHLLSYFLGLPCYAGFVHRFKRLGAGFKELVAYTHHAYTAKVASEVAGKNFNATKKMYYYGVKAHVVARKNQACLPDIELFIVDTASRQDGPIFDEWLRPNLGN